MKRVIRSTLLAVGLAAGLAAPTAFAQVSFSLNYDVPGTRIGVNLGGYPALQPVPGYPVYYAPGVNANYFFYDGLYWVFDGYNWYASSWYNGPWAVVDPFEVPTYVLQVPVRYYHRPPTYFHGWAVDRAPRWGDHWGRGWEDRRRGWDRHDARARHAPAPLPTYQREYRGDRYPDFARQQQLREERYRYQPRDDVSRRHYDESRQQARQQWQQRDAQRQQQAVQRQQQVQPQPQQQHRGPGNSDFGHQQGQGRGREHAPGQQGRQNEARQAPAQGERPQQLPGWYSGG
jgi:hypothetical protein